MMAHLSHARPSQGPEFDVCRFDLQARTAQRRWVAGDAAAGEDVAVADLDFEIKHDKDSGRDLVVVREQHTPANHLATLAKHVMRFEQITRDMEVHVQQSAILVAGR
jgi:hypothetical protein